MATLTQSSTGGPNARTITPQTLTSSDTFTYLPGVRQRLIFMNTTAGSITATITGSTATSIFAPGGGSVNYATGLAVVVPAGAARLVDCDNIANYLVGVIAITGGTGLTALLLADA